MPPIDWDNHGPYPRHWNESERDLWDSEPQNIRDLYDSPQEWRELQEAFERGWLEPHVSPEYRAEWRERYFDMTGSRSFNWGEYRRYLNEYESDSVA